MYGDIPQGGASTVMSCLLSWRSDVITDEVRPVMDSKLLPPGESSSEKSSKITGDSPLTLVFPDISDWISDCSRTCDQILISSSTPLKYLLSCRSPPMRSSLHEVPACSAKSVPR